MSRTYLADPSFWSATGERAVKTFAQTLVALLSTNAAGITDVAWLQVLSAAALATVLSVLTSIASSGTGPTGGPSLTGAEMLPDEGPTGQLVRELGDTPTPGEVDMDPLADDDPEPYAAGTKVAATRHDRTPQ